MRDINKNLDTSNVDALYYSLSEILETSEVSIRYYVMRNVFKLNKFNSATKLNVYDFINFLSNSKQDLIKRIEINKITISHLTSRLNHENLHMHNVYNLFDALTKDTDLSIFLRKEGFSFINHNGKLIVNFKGIPVIWDNYFEDHEGPAARMLQRRFEGNRIFRADKCVNGFLFNGKIYENGNVRHIYHYPEVLENLLRVLGRETILYKWTEKSDPYIIIFNARTDDIIFDECSKLNNRQKIFRILRYCLYYLSRNIFDEWNEYDNPIIRLKDNLNVSKVDIIKIIKCNV